MSVLYEQSIKAILAITKERIHRRKKQFKSTDLPYISGTDMKRVETWI